jgi:hypothetical protein
VLYPVKFTHKSRRHYLICELGLGDFEGYHVADFFPFGRGLVVILGPRLQSPTLVFSLRRDIYQRYGQLGPNTSNIKLPTKYLDFLPRTDKLGHVTDSEIGWWHFHPKAFRTLDNDGFGHDGLVIVKPIQRHFRAFHSFEITFLHWLLVEVTEPSAWIASYAVVQVRVINLVRIASGFTGRCLESNDTRSVPCDAI